MELAIHLTSLDFQVHFQVKHLESVPSVIICITNKHAVFTAVCQLAVQLLCIINNGNLFKNMESVELSK